MPLPWPLHATDAEQWEKKTTVSIGKHDNEQPTNNGEPFSHVSTKTKWFKRDILWRKSDDVSLLIQRIGSGIYAEFVDRWETF